MTDYVLQMMIRRSERASVNVKQMTDKRKFLVKQSVFLSKSIAKIEKNQDTSLQNEKQIHWVLSQKGEVPHTTLQ